MKQTININNLLFSRTRAAKKLEIIRNLSNAEIRNTTEATMLRIYKECRGKSSDGKPNDRFCIACERRKGNNWNSTIEFISEYKKKLYLTLYVQTSSTDSSVVVSYNEFNCSNKYYGYCESLNKHFTYNNDDIVRTIRCILEEYIYYKYINRAEREYKERIEKMRHSYYPVCDYFYKEWRCWYSTTNKKRYHRAVKAVKQYVEEHLEELEGKTAEELQNIYRKIFRQTN